MATPIRVGIIGYGSSAKVFHLPYIVPNSDLSVYAFLQRAEAPKDKSGLEPGTHCTIDHPNAKHYRTTEDFFADSNIDLVIVCTTHPTHFPLAQQALQAAKHVVVEKPFVLTSEQASTLASLSKQHNKICTVFQNRRYDSDFLTLKHYIDKGVFGEITEFSNHYDVDNPPWAHGKPGQKAELGDGLLYGLGSHSIDQTLQLFGQPKSVTAFIRNLVVESGADDSFTVILQYEKNLICTIKTTINTPVSLARSLKYWVRGTKGVFVKNGEDVQIEHLLEKSIEVTEEGYGVEPAYYHAYLSTRGDDGVKFDGVVPSQRGRYVDYYKDVVAAIRGEKDVVCTAEQGTDCIRVIELARESAEKGVTVPWS